ncbi:hypothetical protein EMCRGX_G031185 [Ephydatia muelleri]
MAFLQTNGSYCCFSDMWGAMLFYSFLMSSLAYLAVGVLCAITSRISRGVSLAIPFIFLIYGELKVIFIDTVACAFVAGIYCTVGTSMIGWSPILWGFGLSALSIALSVAVTMVPLYSFL